MGHHGGMSRRPAPLTAIFLTVLLDMLGFGLAVPDLQIRGDRLSESALWTGFALALYSIAQLISAPWLGRLSDRLGRRTVLLATTVAAALGYLVYSQAETLGALLVARALAGVAGGNLSVAYAYITDVTEPKERASSMGMMGVAFGLGFILGPPVGAHLVHADGGSPMLLGIVGCSLAVINFLFLYFFLPESPRRERSAQVNGLWRDTIAALRTPLLGRMLWVFLFTNLAFANLQSTFFLLAQRQFGLAEHKASFVLVLVGVVSVVMQGGVVRVVAPRFGEHNMLRFGLLLIVPSLAILPFAVPWGPLLVVMAMVGVATGLYGPASSSLISRYAPPQMVGQTFGITHALGAMARVAAPLIALPLMEFGAHKPYLLAAALMVIPLALCWSLRTESAVS